MTDSSDHKNTIREEFTRQAAAYAANSSINNSERVARLIRATNPSAEARVLEVATGPGYVALGFATVCREVVGLDLTEAPLRIAERTRQERGLNNVRFQEGDAENIPFEEGDFDVVLCRFAFHHFEDPSRVLRQMVRVCRPNGIIAVEDLIVSEHPSRGEYQNRFEQLRDSSHKHAYSLTELIGLFAATGLEVENVYTDALTQGVERWLSNAQTPSSKAAEVRAMIERDAVEDLSSTRPFRRDGHLYFIQRTGAIVGYRLDNTSSNAV